jgi:hypothetical protein
VPHRPNPRHRGRAIGSRAGRTAPDCGRTGRDGEPRARTNSSRARAAISRPRLGDGSLRTPASGARPPEAASPSSRATSGRRPAGREWVDDPTPGRRLPSRAPATASRPRPAPTVYCMLLYRTSGADAARASAPGADEPGRFGPRPGGAAVGPSLARRPGLPFGSGDAPRDASEGRVSAGGDRPAASASSPTPARGTPAERSGTGCDAATPPATGANAPGDPGSRASTDPRGSPVTTPPPTDRTARGRHPRSRRSRRRPPPGAPGPGPHAARRRSDARGPGGADVRRCCSRAHATTRRPGRRTVRAATSPQAPLEASSADASATGRHRHQSAESAREPTATARSAE